MFCRSCGKEIREGVRYCTKCGTDSASAVASATAASLTPVKDARNSRSLQLALAAGGFVVALVVVGSVVAISFLGASGSGGSAKFVELVVGAWDCPGLGIDYVEIRRDGTFQTRSGGSVGTTIHQGTWTDDSGTIRLDSTLGDRPNGSFTVQGGDRLYSLKTFGADGRPTDPALGWIDSLAFSESGNVVDITLASQRQSPGASVEKQDVRCTRA